MLSAASVKALQEASSAGSGAAFATVCLYPLDIAKSRLVSKTGAEFKDDNTVSTLMDLVKEGGLLALYRGVGAKLSQTVVQSFAYFYIYSSLKGAAVRHGLKLDTRTNLVVGYLAAVGNLLVSLPLEVLAIRMQVGDKGTSLASVIKSVLKADGISGFYRGLKASIVLCINPAINYTVFEQIRTRALKTRPAGANLTAFEAFLMGVVAKFVATIITYPYIRAKVVIQAAKGSSSSSSSSSPSSSTSQSSPSSPSSPSSSKTPDMEPASDSEEEEKAQTPVGVLLSILKTEGPWGLYKGLPSQLFRTVLASALMLMAKEKINAHTAAFIASLFAARAAERAAKGRSV